jgi:DNA-directed RNA polymerase alpha subunit
MDRPSRLSILDLPIEELFFLSAKTHNLLKEAKITTFRQLIEINTSELKKCKWYGRTCLDELREHLALLGLSLNEEH